MMREQHYEESNGNKTILPAIIKPKFALARNCLAGIVGIVSGISPPKRQTRQHVVQNVGTDTAVSAPQMLC
jgi:hypothetical protein